MSRNFLSTLLATVVMMLAAPVFAANDQPRWSAEAEAVGLWQVYVDEAGNKIPGPNTRLVQVMIGGELVEFPQTIISSRGIAPDAAGPQIRNCYRSTGSPRFCWLTYGLRLTQVDGHTRVTYPDQRDAQFGVRGQDRSNAEGEVFGNGPGPSGQAWWASYDALSIRSLRVYNAQAGGCEAEYAAKEAGTFVGFNADGALPLTETCDWNLINGSGNTLPLGDVITAIDVKTYAHEITPVYVPGKTITCSGNVGSGNGSLCTGSGAGGAINEPLSGNVGSVGGLFTFRVPEGTVCTVTHTGATQPVCDRIFANDFD